jgi:hypothetical protein
MANVLGELVEPGTRVAIIGKNSFEGLLHDSVTDWVC